MTTSNAVTVDKTIAKAGEKLAEKRRALGRGLESLLPGPRVVPAAPTLPQDARTDGAADSSSSSSPSSSTSSLSASAAEFAGGRPGAAVAPPETVLDRLQAVASGQTADGETVYQLVIDLIDENPHQTRMEFDENALQELANSITVQGVLQPIVV